MIRKIFIGGHDRGGTTLLATFLAGIPNSEVLFETPFKFKYLVNDKKKLNYFCKEFKESKYHLAFGFKHFPSQELVNGLFYSKDQKVIIDHTPKNILFKKELEHESALFLFINRELKALYLAHKRVSWGIKSPLRFVIWHNMIVQLSQRYSEDHNVEILKFEDLIIKKEDYLRQKIQKYGLNISKRAQIKLAEYTIGQHKKVNKELDTSKLLTEKSQFSFMERLILKDRLVYRLVAKIILFYRVK